VLSPRRKVVAEGVPVALNSVVPTVAASIFHTVPELESVISPLSPSGKPE